MNFYSARPPVVVFILASASLLSVMCAHPNGDAPVLPTPSGARMFNPQKVRPCNAPGVNPPCQTSALVAGRDTGNIDLRTYLVDSVDVSSVKWTVDGNALASYRFNVGRPPSPNEVRTVTVAAAISRGPVVDRFLLVIVPQPTLDEFRSWLARQKEDIAWISKLPPVYSRLAPGGGNPEPESCRPRLWPVLRKIQVNYHPGAAYEMRSAIQPDGSGHQATYDAAGQLIEVPPGAGSADRAGPRSYNIFRLIRHKDLDVMPYLWAAQLDGNPVQAKTFAVDFDRPLVRVGEYIDAYLSVRPVFDASRQKLEPGVCSDGRPPAQSQNRSSR